MTTRECGHQQVFGIVKLRVTAEGRIGAEIEHWLALGIDLIMPRIATVIGGPAILGAGPGQLRDVMMFVFHDRFPLLCPIGRSSIEPCPITTLDAATQRRQKPLLISDSISARLSPISFSIASSMLARSRRWRNAIYRQPYQSNQRSMRRPTQPVPSRQRCHRRWVKL